ncbi:MAG: hypothetical protein U0P30_18590 [Vicinamibacterales bacterium]
MRSSLRLAAPCVALTLLLAAPASTAAAPVLRAVDARIRFDSATSCSVALTFTVQGASQVEHRLEVLDGAEVRSVQVAQAVAGEPRDVGRTRALVVTPSADGTPYTLRYEVRQSDARAHRCPLWLPTVPTDGRSRAVHLVTEVPSGTTVVGGMPSFTWQGARGEVTLAHLPAFVIVPFADAAALRPWDVSRVMDTVALGTLALASLAWLARQKGRA